MANLAFFFETVPITASEQTYVDFYTNLGHTVTTYQSDNSGTTVTVGDMADKAAVILGPDQPGAPSSFMNNDLKTLANPILAMSSGYANFLLLMAGANSTVAGETQADILLPGDPTITPKTGTITMFGGAQEPQSLSNFTVATGYFEVADWTTSAGQSAVGRIEVGGQLTTGTAPGLRIFHGTPLGSSVTDLAVDYTDILETSLNYALGGVPVNVGWKGILRNNDGTLLVNGTNIDVRVHAGAALNDAALYGVTNQTTDGLGELVIDDDALGSVSDPIRVSWVNSALSESLVLPNETVIDLDA